MLGRSECLVLAALYIIGCSILVGGEQEASKRGSSDYKGLTIFEVQPRNDRDVDFLYKLKISQAEVDFLEEPRRTLNAVLFTAPAKLRTEVRGKLERANLSYKEQDFRDYLNKLKLDTVGKVGRIFKDPPFNLDRFNNLDDINVYTRDLTSRCPSDITCQLYSIGKSIEGRDIFVFKISKGSGAVRRKGFWLDATIHAREWLTTATALKILHHLVSRTDPTARRLVDSYDWFVAPVLNPDGYAYSVSYNRLWTKNRRPYDDRFSCIGVDLNRNFDFKWGTEDVSHNPCSDTYGGTKGGSEPEVDAIQKEALRLGPSLIGWVNLHGKGRMWMFPYGEARNRDGTNCVRTDDYEDLMGVAEAAADAVERTYDTKWKRGTTCEVLSENSGTSVDYIKDVAKVKYSYVLELRDDNIGDTSVIHSSFVEVFNGLVAMCDAIAIRQKNKKQ